MTRLPFPDRPTGLSTWLSPTLRTLNYPGRRVTVYADRACTTLADIETPAGVPIPASTMYVNSAAEVPEFLGPPDGTGVLYVKVTGMPGVVELAAGDGMTAGVAVAATVRLDRDTAHRGISLAGAEFGSVGDAYGTSWAHPPASDFDFVAERGYTLVRLPFLWERLQPTLGGDFDQDEAARLITTIANARSAGLKVMLDLHNYGAYGGKRFGEAGGPTLGQFCDVWLRLSTLFATDPAVAGYGLMNEPRYLPTVGAETGRDRWLAWSQAAVTAIRDAGDDTCILVSGYDGGSMGAWQNATLGTPVPWIFDPADNFRYEAHHYWDTGTSNNGTYQGTYAAELAATGGSSSLDTVLKNNLGVLHRWVNWLRINNVLGFVGEFGWPRVYGVTNASDSAKWNNVADQYLDVADACGSLLWTSLWATGSQWSAGYNLNFYLKDGTGKLATPAENAATAEAHPTFVNVDKRFTKGIFPSDYGRTWRGYNFDPVQLTANSTLTPGVPLYLLCSTVDAGRFDAILINLGVAGAGAVDGQCFAALYGMDGKPFAVTDDIGALLTAGLGIKELPLTAPTRTFQPNELFYVMLLFNGTTGPQLGRGAAGSGPVGFMTRRWGVGPAATSVPASVDFATLTAAPGSIWAGVSGY